MTKFSPFTWKGWDIFLSSNEDSVYPYKAQKGAGRLVEMSLPELLTRITEKEKPSTKDLNNMARQRDRACEEVEQLKKELSMAEWASQNSKERHEKKIKQKERARYRIKKEKNRELVPMKAPDKPERLEIVLIDNSRDIGYTGELLYGPEEGAAQEA